ncbi:hypothetical protein K474DRAFT_1590781 [Panus rudis PR-1116 ss-1]|nr:hypothetical protein K474DRAFT_1590781 [Panus rudis PR-1116 ss-1]
MSHPRHASRNAQDEPSFHRSRPSLTTNASGIADSTISFSSVTTEGLARLSQFPPPPAGVPISPFEAKLFSSVPTPPPTIPPDSPRHERPMTDEKAAFQTIPAPSSPQRDEPPTPGSSLQLLQTPPSITGRRQLPTPPGPGSPTRFVPAYVGFTSPATSYTSLPTTHDWHEGSSSVAMDAYSDRMLPTSFITDLLTSQEHAYGEAPPRYKRDPYEPSVTSGIYSTESTITYPPRRIMPEPLPRTPMYTESESSHAPVTLTEPSTLHSPPQGRATPISTITYESSAEQYGHPNIVQTATVSRGVGAELGAVGVAHASTRSLSIAAPSLVSQNTQITQNSSDPLIPRAFPQGDTIQEDEREGDYSGASSSAGPSRTKRERRQSTYSSKTTKSYVSSLITRLSHSTGERKSLKQATQWFRRKPLPPVPRLPDLSIAQEAEHRKQEAALPLPELVNRAQTLHQLLDKGHRPHQSEGNISYPDGSGSYHVSLPSSGVAGVENFTDGQVRNSGAVAHPGFMHSARGRKGRSQDLRQSTWTGHTPPDTPPSKPRRFVLPTSKKHRIWLAAGVFAIIAIVVIAVAVGATVSKRHSGPVCTGNLTGAACSLDATCVCTSTVAGQCNQVAQSLIKLVPTLNTQFGTAFNETTLGKAVWNSQGSPGKDCSKQARLVDVAPALDPETSPNRTQWAQAALLWDLIESQNLDDVATLQRFVTKADWQSLGSSDGPTTSAGSKFATTVSGYTFDFAAQTVTAPPVKFTDVGQASREQIGRANDVSIAALDRMYTFATASATQQQKALSMYWTGVLQQDPAKLTNFISNVIGSPILLPFDVTSSPGSHPITSLMTNSSTDPFPPPLACYPGLNSTQLQTVSTFESSVFGLSAPNAAQQFDKNCFANHPIYGILNLLQLRLPFTTSRPVARQAAVLRREAYPRAVIYSGEVLSALPDATTTPNLTSTVTDPRQFGTVNNIHHVLLNYLSSFPDVNLAIALVRTVLNPSVVPPTSDNALFSALDSIPALEVAVFGNVLPADISGTVSSFATPSGNLFFGTDQSLVLRQWTIDAAQSSIAWAERATSPEVVRDSSFTDDAFNGVWNPAFNFFHTPNNAVVNVGNITASFQAVGKFSP